jgi:hypothetical protein
VKVLGALSRLLDGCSGVLRGLRAGSLLTTYRGPEVISNSDRLSSKLTDADLVDVCSSAERGEPNSWMVLVGIHAVATIQ